MVLSTRAAELQRLMSINTLADMRRFLPSPMPVFLVAIAVQPGPVVLGGEPPAANLAVNNGTLTTLSLPHTLAHR